MKAGQVETAGLAVTVDTTLVVTAGLELFETAGLAVTAGPETAGWVVTAQQMVTAAGLVMNSVVAAGLAAIVLALGVVDLTN